MIEVVKSVSDIPRMPWCLGTSQESFVDIVLDNMETCCRILQWYTSDCVTKVLKTRFQIDPYVWNRVAPGYLLNKRLRHVVLRAIKHQHIMMPIWIPDCEKLDSEFLVPSDHLCVTTTPSMVHLAFFENEWTFPYMERHNSVDMLVCEGSQKKETRIMIEDTPPPKTRKIIVKNAQVTKDLFEYIMKTYNHIELLNVTIHDNTYFSGCFCHAEYVHIPASLLMYVTHFVSCKKLKLLLDIEYIDKREEQFEKVHAYGVINTTQEYMDMYRSAYDAFPNNPDSMCIDIDIGHNRTDFL